ncbi:MAG: mucoidy inhibitor MuiA family protein, partial [Flavobacteriales bacterium]|nr:mucoidy inhibitor MuiA family protein [Flavobacteriales bacterium]
MRTLLTILLSAFVLCAVAQDNEITLSSTIKEVTVFQSGAQVSRVSRTNLPVGTHQLIFEELNPTINANQVKVTGTGDFTILSISHDYKTDTLSGWDIAIKQREMTQKRQEIQDQINRENGWLEIYNREEQLLQQNQIFGSAKEGTDLDKLIAAADFTRTRYIEIREARLQIQDKVAELQKKVNKINEDLGKLGYVETKQQLRMIVRVKAKKAEVAKFKLDYQVNNAGWYPSYDARVENIEEPMILDYNAYVFQTSGEDWEDIKLTISTGTPKQNKVKPKLTPWNLHAQAPTPVYTRPAQPTSAGQANRQLQRQAWNPNVRSVNGVVRDEFGQPIPFVNVTISGTATGTTTDVNGYYNISIPNGYGILNYSYVGYSPVQLNASSTTMNVVMGGNMIQLDEVQLNTTNSIGTIESYSDADMSAYNNNSGSLFKKREKEEETRANFQVNYANVKVAYSPTQTQFSIDANYNIPSNGSHYSVRVNSHEIPADYLSQWAPKLDPTAYLTARITDWSELNLLPGKMNIYFEDTYVGESNLDLTYIEDTLQVSLGPDKNIQVRRRKMKSEHKGELMTNKKRDEAEWEIVVVNSKRQPITIRIEDQIPLSNNDEVEIDSSLD